MPEIRASTIQRMTLGGVGRVSRERVVDTDAQVFVC